MSLPFDFLDSHSSCSSSLGSGKLRTSEQSIAKARGELLMLDLIAYRHPLDVATGEAAIVAHRLVFRLYH